MMKKRRLISVMVLTGFLTVTTAQAEEKATTKSPTHEGPSVSIPADQIKFMQTGVKKDGKELQAGPAYGNLQTSKHGTFVKMPAGFSSPIHTHTEDYYAVVIKGVAANHPPGAKDVALPVGSYWFQKGEESHVTKCLSKEDCLFFLVQPGKFDYVMSK